MTLETLFLLLITTHLVLVAYGIVGGRRRLGSRARLLAAGLLAWMPPGLIAATLAATGEEDLVARWGRLFLLMGVAGTAVAWVADRTARRVNA